MKKLSTMHVKPSSEKLVVLDPTTRRRIPAEGLEVPRTTYWMRRLRAGEVVEFTPKPAKS